MKRFLISSIALVAFVGSAVALSVAEPETYTGTVRANVQAIVDGLIGEAERE